MVLIGIGLMTYGLWQHTQKNYRCHGVYCLVVNQLWYSAVIRNDGASLCRLRELLWKRSIRGLESHLSICCFYFNSPVYHRFFNIKGFHPDTSPCLPLFLLLLLPQFCLHRWSVYLCWPENEFVTMCYLSTNVITPLHLVIHLPYWLSVLDHFPFYWLLSGMPLAQWWLLWDLWMSKLMHWTDSGLAGYWDRPMLFCIEMAYAILASPCSRRWSMLRHPIQRNGELSHRHMFSDRLEPLSVSFLLSLSFPPVAATGRLPSSSPSSSSYSIDPWDML
jgi:hypothetical protein